MPLFYAQISNLQFAGTVIGSLVALGAVFGGAGYLWSRITGGRSQAQSEISASEARTVLALKDLLDAQEKKIKSLDDSNRENVRELGKLQGIIEEQSKQAKWFETVMVEALEEFFKKNPEMAFELQKRLPSMSNKTA